MAAKWKALLFMAGVLLLLPVTLLPANWLSTRGLLQGPAAWTAAMNWGVFIAALAPTRVAACYEGQPVGGYGLPWRPSRVQLLAEGLVWGLGAAGFFAGMLHFSGLVRGVGATTGMPEAIRSGATWGLSLLGFALFDQCLKRGYLQSTLARALGFWQAAWLLSVLFALERLLVYRNPLALAAFVAIHLLSCLTLRRTGDLWFAVGLQTGLDWSMAFLFGMKGLPFTSLRPPDGPLMSVDLLGPAWMTGGTDGFYGSACFLGVVAMLAWGVQRRFQFPRST